MNYANRISPPFFETTGAPEYIIDCDYLQGYQKVFRHLKFDIVTDWLMWIKIALDGKFSLISWPHFLKISFKLIKCGLSYSLKGDPRPFSKCIKVCTILSLKASKNAFWRLPLIDGTFNWEQFYLSINIETPVYQCIFGGCQWENGPNLSRFWEWPRITF